MSERCQKCGSARIVPNLIILDQGRHSDGNLKAVGYANPEAWVFKGAVYARMSASVCGDCGHTEIHTANHAALYEAYVASLQNVDVASEYKNPFVACLSCGQMIPPSANRCAACGWSYLDQPAE